jgi:hypothetical protein
LTIPLLEGEVLAVLEGDLVSDEASHLVRRLRIRLVRDGLPPADADEQTLARALSDVNDWL